MSPGSPIAVRNSRARSIWMFNSNYQFGLAFQQTLVFDEKSNVKADTTKIVLNPGLRILPESSSVIHTQMHTALWGCGSRISDIMFVDVTSLNDE